MRHTLSIILLYVTTLLAVAQPTLNRGDGRFVYSGYTPFADRPIEVNYCIPEQGDMTRMPVIFVFQGADRAYDYLMRAWGKAARDHGFMVFIPQFDKERFPLCDYQEVGVMDRSHTHVRQCDSITPALIDRLFEHVRSLTGSKRTTYNIYGHSAGGQFVHRMMLFHDSPYVDCAVSGSPGWYTFPDTAAMFPYGVTNIPYIDSDRLRRYLAKNLVVQLAPCDSVREWFLRKTPEADAQGLNRYERGLAFWDFAHRLAARNGWTCNWRKADVPDVGHISEAMGMAAIPYLLDPASGSIPPSTDTVEYVPADTITTRFTTLAAKYHEIMRIDTIDTGTISIRLAKPTGDSGRKARVWLQGALHGNEPAGPQVLYRTAMHIIDSDLLDSMEVMIVPVANPEGYAARRRTADNGLDLNRDLSKLAHPHTRALMSAFNAFGPDVAVDLHEYNPHRAEFAKSLGHRVTTGYDVLLLLSGHLNVDTALQRMVTDDLVADIRKALTSRLYTSDIYFAPHTANDGSLMLTRGATSPRSTSTAWALSGIASIFVEIKGIRLGDETIHRRIDCGTTVTTCILDRIHRDKTHILRTVDAARHRATSATGDIIIKSTPRLTDTKVDFRDTSTGIMCDAIFPTLDALAQNADVSRTRPEAYLILDPERSISDRLAALGIQYTTHESTASHNVTAYHVDNIKVSDNGWEGIHTVDADVSLMPCLREFGPDYITVPVSQPRGNLVVTLLEPDSPQGFVNFGVITAYNGKELSIYRIEK